MKSINKIMNVFVSFWASFEETMGDYCSCEKGLILKEDINCEENAIKYIRNNLGIFENLFTEEGINIILNSYPGNKEISNTLLEEINACILTGSYIPVGAKDCMDDRLLVYSGRIYFENLFGGIIARNVYANTYQMIYKKDRKQQKKIEQQMYIAANAISHFKSMLESEILGENKFKELVLRTVNGAVNCELKNGSLGYTTHRMRTFGKHMYV